MTLRTGLDLVVLGLVMVLLDLRLGGFDLLSDPAGYGLAVLGVLTIYASLTPPLRRLAGAAAALYLAAAFLSIPGGFIEVPSPRDFAILTDPVTRLNGFANMAAVLGHLALLGAIARHAAQAEAPLLEGQARFAARLNIVALVVMTYVAFLALAVGPGVFFTALAGLILGFIAILVTLAVLVRARGLPPNPPRWGPLNPAGPAPPERADTSRP